LTDKYNILHSKYFVIIVSIFINDFHLYNTLHHLKSQPSHIVYYASDGWKCPSVWRDFSAGIFSSAGL